MTAVGTFSLKLNLDYGLAAGLLIQLQQFRTIVIAANFTGTVFIDVQFTYGIVNILEFGLYVSGNLLRAELSPKLILHNILPIQLVDAIA